MEYVAVPKHVWQRVVQASEMVLNGQAPTLKAELIGKREFMRRTGCSEGSWEHLTRTGSDTIVKRKGNGGNNVRVMIDWQAYQKQFQ